MTSTRSTLVFILITVLLIVFSSASSLTETFRELEREIDQRLSEIDTDVFDDFKKKYKCHNCDDKTLDMLLHEYEAFKRNWIADMVNFIIKELDIDEEKAQFVRANPDKYFVDYQTFKLLSFS